MMKKNLFVRRLLAAPAVLVVVLYANAAVAQVLDTTPSRETLEEASGESCDGVSGVLRRCAQQANDADAKAAAKRSTDALTRSRSATKESFDRENRRTRDEALKEGKPDPGVAKASGTQRLGGVTVTGNAGRDATPEEILERNLAPPPPSQSATTTRYAADGSRFECIEKCVGPACCVPVRNLPNPARDSNSIGR